MEIGGFGLVALVGLGLALAAVFMGVKAVPQGREYTVERSAATCARCSPPCT
jgi:hypothetical protein